MIGIVQKMLTTDLRALDNQQVFDMMSEGAKEIQRLRAALNQIDNIAVSHSRGAIGKAQQIARKALVEIPR